MNKIAAIILMFLMALAVVPSSAVAFGSAGNQCEESPRNDAVDWFNDRGIDQPVNWIDQPAAYRFGPHTYVTWQGGPGFVPCIKRFDHTTLEWSPTIQLAATNPIAGDGHGAPTVFITPGGKIHVTYGAHDTPIKYVRGDVSDFLNGWETMADLAADATYPHMVYVQARLWLFYRLDICSAWLARTTVNEGTTWVSAGEVISHPGLYVGGITVGEDGFSIWFHATATRNCPTDPFRRDSYAFYYLPDAGNQFWCKNATADVSIGFSVPNPIPASCKIETAEYSVFGNVRKIGPGIQTGTPHVLYAVGNAAPTGAWAYRFATWDGSAWNIETITGADHYIDFSDFRLQNASNIDAYVLDNYTNYQGSKDGGILNRYHFNGTSWDFAETILHPDNTTGNLLSAPFVPVNGYDELVFNERIVSLDDAASKMYLWSDSLGLVGLGPGPSDLAAFDPFVTLLGSPAFVMGLILLLALAVIGGFLRLRSRER